MTVIIQGMSHARTETTEDLIKRQQASALLYDEEQHAMILHKVDEAVRAFSAKKKLHQQTYADQYQPRRSPRKLGLTYN